MHIVIQISPVEVVKALSNNFQGQAFQQALKNAEKLQHEVNESFIDLFYQKYQQLAPAVPLTTIFASSRSQDYIDINSSDAQVLKLEEMLPYWQPASQYWTSQHVNSPTAPDTATDALALEQQLMEDTTAVINGFPVFDLTASDYRLTYSLADTAEINATLEVLKQAQALPMI